MQNVHAWDGQVQANSSLLSTDWRHYYSHWTDNKKLLKRDIDPMLF